MYVFSLLWIIEVIPWWGCIRTNLKAIPEFSAIIAAITALFAAVLTFLLNEISKVSVLAQDEAAQKKLEIISQITPIKDFFRFSLLLGKELLSL